MKVADLFAQALGIDRDPGTGAPWAAGGSTGAGSGIAISAWDGSRTGPADPIAEAELRSPRAIMHLATGRGTLGLARAYVLGDLEVHGDMYATLRELADRVNNVRRPTVRQVLAATGPSVLRWPTRPPEEVRLRGGRHAKHRDAKAISHHYDVSNRFYELVLGPSMAYTCAVYPSAEATLEEAQEEKFDLVARKLDLQPGMRLLDVGCGWGSMVMHAARQYGVRALGVTLSLEQAQWAQRAIEEAGLSGLAEVRHMDYRDVSESGFDAVSSIGLTEHIGGEQLPAYTHHLLERLRPGGRLLNHCIIRPDTSIPTIYKDGFINRYVFPDGEILALGPVINAIHDAGFEVRHEENLREHYALTLAAWGENLERNWDAAVAEVGERRARVWRAYMAGCRFGFERNQVQLHQVLAVKPQADGTSGMPLRPTWERRPETISLPDAGARV
jgi:cyclopropane-fatty-acyl-phospholipid synthase